MKESCVRSWLNLPLCFIAFLFLPGVYCQSHAMSDPVPQSQPSQSSWSSRSSPGESIVFGRDNRTLVSDTTKSPYSAIGHIVCQYADGMALGTGALIGNKTVLTAGHMVYEPSLGTPQSVTFIPAQSGSKEPFGEINATYRYVPQQWKDGNQDYDLGLLVLDQEIGKQTGYFQVATELDSFFTNQPLKSAGYPADLGDGFEMYSVSGNSTDVQRVVMLHRITTEEGQSGSPFWFTSNGVPTVVGLNVGWEQLGSPDGSITCFGLGTRVDTELGRLINTVLSQNGDVIQENLPAPSGTVASLPASSTTTTSAAGTASITDLCPCGLGAGQAMVMLSLAWAACFAGRSLKRA